MPYETYMAVIDGQVVTVKKYKMVVADLEPAGRMVRPRSSRLRMGVATTARLGMRHDQTFPGQHPADL